jgi:hypothetical protein
LRRYDPPKRPFLQELHNVTSQKTPFFIITAVKNLKSYEFMVDQETNSASMAFVTVITEKWRLATIVDDIHVNSRP